MQPLNRLIVSQRNTISTSSTRCDSCSRYLIIEQEKEFCFYCQEIAKEDQEIADKARAMIDNREVNELMERFERLSLMNKNLKEATLNEYKPITDSQTLARQRAVKYITEFDNVTGLLIFGAPGVGKSHIAAAIAKALLKARKSTIFISMPRLLTELKNTYNRNADITEVQILSALQKADLLVIDDLGAERSDEDDKATAWAKSKIYEIVDARVGLATIYTTNYAPLQLINMYGERDFGRMVQNVEPLKIEGPDNRLEKFKRM